MLRILHAGFFSTVQDLGRVGYRDKGVPVSGAMDLYSAQFANALLGNAKDAALIEMTMLGGKFQFFDSTVVAISGAFMRPMLNDEALLQNRLIKIQPNDVLHFGGAEKGFRTYLAVKGGFKTETILGSRSMYSSVTNQSVIKKDDHIIYEPYQGVEKAFSKVKYDDTHLESNVLDVFKGVEFDMLSENQKQQLFSKDFLVSKNNNRMAYQLEPVLDNNLKPILSSPVLPGTIQLTPHGNLIVLMRDCQTTGGYPRILQLTEKAINTIAQKTLGNSIKFRQKE
ncbi:allophanate hydrolase [Winogradskyella sp. J14-2]|uniref:5-oxoprolinase subunit C family protein n=1 Tax=Winogradskyella sp. J14-2 TaxID=1936080 RepID=UPI000972C45B|nr:biotin-dependent carboxyltransferase family protein [Winogradskyella sp. J14-2]APY07365.1 allophanate hydrolase [Winogradskyella sp. J14-2]